MDIKIIIALYAIPITLVLLYIYKKVLNPIIIAKPDLSKMSKCPDAWIYDDSTQLCSPNYKTDCLPYNPNTPLLTTYEQRCQLARRCNTTWSGLCT
jgi:hypothetical protein